MHFRNNNGLRIVNIILIVLMVITALIVWGFRSDSLLQDRLFAFMESFFHKSLDHAEWQERFNGSWIFFPLVAELKVFALIWIGWGLAWFLKSDTGKVKDCIKFITFLNSQKLAGCISGIMVFLFAAAVYFTPRFIPGGTGEHTGIAWVILSVAIYLGIIAALISIFSRNGNKEEYNQAISFNKGHLILIFILITIIDFIWFIVYYPGTGMTDTGVVFQQGLTISSQHPWLYCLMIDVMVRIMKVLGLGYEGALVFLCWVQIILSAIVLTHCIYILLRDGVNIIICYSIAFFYIFCPIIGLYTVFLVKDILFASVMLEWMIFLYEYWKSNGQFPANKKDILRLTVLTLGMMIRGNGSFIIAFVLVCMLLLDICNYKKVLLICFILMCTLTLGSTVESAGGITHNFRETVGIPLQQMSAVAADNGNITDEQKTFINQIIPIDDIKVYYNPYDSCAVKFRDNFNWEFLNENRGKFMKTWWDMLKKNISIYVEAYERATCGFWAVKRGNIERFDSINYAFDKSFTDANNIRVKSILPENLQLKMESILYPLTDIAPGEGQLFWLFSILMIVFVLINGNKSFIVIAPVFGGYISLLIATPVAYCWRYVYFIALAIPFIVGLFFVKEPISDQGRSDDHD